MLQVSSKKGSGEVGKRDDSRKLKVMRNWSQIEK